LCSSPIASSANGSEHFRLRRSPVTEYFAYHGSSGAARHHSAARGFYLLLPGTDGVLQDQLCSVSLAAPRDPPTARSESPCLALPDKFEGSADRCRGFLRQCEGIGVGFRSVGRRSPNQIVICFFSGMIREVFEYPAGGKDISIQLMELRQGSDAAADYAIRFRTLAAQSGWNDVSLWAVFRAGLKPELQAELACRTEDTTLSQFVATATAWIISCANTRQGHHVSPPASGRRSQNPCNWGGPDWLSRHSNNGAGCGCAITAGLPGTSKPSVSRKTFIGTAIDSRPIGEGYLKRQTELLKFRVGLFHHERLAFYVISSPANPVILGFPWLRRHDPQISWRTGELVRWSPACKEKCLRDQVPRPCWTSCVRESPLIIPAHPPQEYAEFREVFSEERAARLPAHQPWDCAINLLPNASPPRGRVYPLSLPESKPMEEYIETALAAGHIRPSAYNLVRIKKGDEWKTAFHTTHRHYEYQVMPFGLTNTPAVFQALINGVFQDLLGKWVIAYIDDILVYSAPLEEHVLHVREVLSRLQQHHLYVKLEKREFHRSTVTFLGYVVSRRGVEMDEVKVRAVTDWSAPTTVRELQRFLGFANFYRRFIRNYSSVAGPLTSLLRGKPKKLTWTDQARAAFQ
ncbi:hypothetical protein QTP70_011158, partial [Hemibagrus guttatus]